MKNGFLAVLTMSALSLAACTETTTGMGNKQMIGAGTGAVLGGVLGSKVGKGSGQLVGVGVGTLLGLMVGSSIGQSLDKTDVMYAQRAEQQAYRAPIGQSVSWNNPDNGRHGVVTPIRDGRTNDGYSCREYKHTIYVDGRSETAVGQACQNSDGTWSIIQ